MDATTQNPHQGQDCDDSVNMACELPNSHLYDGEGRICAVMSEAIPGTYSMTGYMYDAEGNRVAKGSLTQFTCDLNPADSAWNGFSATNLSVLGPNGEQLSETDGNGNWLHSNVYAAGALIGRVAPVLMVVFHHFEGAPGALLLGTGEGATDFSARRCGARVFRSCTKGQGVRSQEIGEFRRD